MNDISIDPALVGIWLLPGEPQTYEITDSGGYFIAEPEEPVTFESDGAVMVWGGRRYLRTEGAGETPIGTWREEETGDAWDFTEDQAVSILIAEAPDEDSLTGIWALRDEGHALWTCEHRAQITSDGAHLVFQTDEGNSLRYGYSVTEDVLSLLDPDTWEEVTRYVSAALFIQTAAASG
jgi:hypothetical protein